MRALVTAANEIISSERAKTETARQTVDEIETSIALKLCMADIAQDAFDDDESMALYLAAKTTLGEATEDGDIMINCRQCAAGGALIVRGGAEVIPISCPNNKQAP